MIFPTWWQKYSTASISNSSYAQVLLYQPLVQGSDNLQAPRVSHRPKFGDSMTAVQRATAEDADGASDKNGISFANALAETHAQILTTGSKIEFRVDHTASSDLEVQPGYEAVTQASGTAKAEGQYWLNDLDPNADWVTVKCEIFVRCIGRGDHRGGSVRNQRLLCRFGPRWYVSAHYSENANTGEGVANGGWIIRQWFQGSTDHEKSATYRAYVDRGQDMDIRVTGYVRHPVGYPIRFGAYLNPNGDPQTLTNWADKGLNIAVSDPVQRPAMETHRFENMKLEAEVKIVNIVLS